MLYGKIAEHEAVFAPGTVYVADQTWAIAFAVSASQSAAKTAHLAVHSGMSVTYQPLHVQTIVPVPVANVLRSSTYDSLTPGWA